MLGWSRYSSHVSPVGYICSGHRYSSQVYYSGWYIIPVRYITPVLRFSGWSVSPVGYVAPVTVIPVGILLRLVYYSSRYITPVSTFLRLVLFLQLPVAPVSTLFQSYICSGWNINWWKNRKCRFNIFWYIIPYSMINCHCVSI